MINILKAELAYYGGPAAVLWGGLNQESLPGRQPAQWPSSTHHAQGRRKLLAFAKLLQVCSERNCTKNAKNSCHLDVGGWFIWLKLFASNSPTACRLLNLCVHPKVAYWSLYESCAAPSAILLCMLHKGSEKSRWVLGGPSPISGDRPLAFHHESAAFLSYFFGFRMFLLLALNVDEIGKNIPK